MKPTTGYPIPRTELPVPSGLEFKNIRQRLGLKIRQVELASRRIALKLRDPRYFLSASRMDSIENHDITPSIFKIFSLAVIYNRSLREVLALFGLDAYAEEDYADCIPSRRTRPIGLADRKKAVDVPFKIDPGFSPRRTALLNRVIEEWTRIPVEFLSVEKFRKYLYVLVGEDDNLLHPMIRSGSVVQVDRSRRLVSTGNWQDEHNRPIYVVQAQQGYRCGWCMLEGHDIILIPHPLSRLCQERYRLRLEAEVVGQVVGIWMSFTGLGPGRTLP